MRIKTYLTDRDWLAVEEDCLESASQQSTSASTAELDRVLTSMVSAQRLVVLAGLGTSLCVKVNEQVRAPTMQRLWDAVKHHFIGSEGERNHVWDEVLRIAALPEGNSDIEALLSRCKLYQMLGRDEALDKIEAFLASAESTIRTEVDFLKPSTPLPVHESFLRRIARRSIRRDRLKVFTTNYDRCFEHAAQRSGFIVIDGFSFAEPATFDPRFFSYDIVRRRADADGTELVENLFQLYKLHGSIDWTIDRRGVKIRKQRSPDRPLLIYPRNSKFELAFEQPYLEMISSFQSCIRQSNTCLLVLGFGFKDTHIAEPLIAAVETNLSLNVVFVSPSIEKDSCENTYISQIAALIDHGDPRLALIESTFEDIVPAIPDMGAKTDLEKHMERIQSARGDRDGPSDSTV